MTGRSILLIGARREDAPESGAVLISEGRIAAMGALDELRSSHGGAEVVDLAGARLLPGFVDGHTHLAEMAVMASGLDLSGAMSLAEIAGQIRGAASGTAMDGWIIGHGWNDARLEENRYVTREDLDAIEPDRPIFLWRFCGHLASCNTAALKRLSVDTEQAGVLKEMAAWRAYRMIPIPQDAYAAGLAAVARRMLSLGVTGVCEMLDRADALDIWRNLPVAPRMAVYLYPDHWPKWKALRAAYEGSPRIEIRGVKFFVDGSLGARTAALTEPYVDGPAEAGGLLIEEKLLIEVLRSAAADNLEVALHAIGDAAVDRILSAAGKAREAGSAPKIRIEHALVIRPDQIDRLRDSGIGLVMQPNFTDGSETQEKLHTSRIGHRSTWLNPFRSLVRAGIPISFGSDCLPPGPLHGLACLSRHPVASERLLLSDGLPLYRKGSPWESPRILEVGAPADLVAIDAPSLEELPLGTIRMVWVGGRPALNSV